MQNAAPEVTGKKRAASSVEPLLFPINKAAGMLSVSRSKFYELIAAGEIRCVRLGARTYVPREEILRIVGVSGEARS